MNCLDFKPIAGCFTDALGVSTTVSIHYVYEDGAAIGQVVTAEDSTVPIDTSTGTLVLGACPVCCPQVLKDPICFESGGTTYEGWEIETVNPLDGSSISVVAVDVDRTISTSTYTILECT